MSFFKKSILGITVSMSILTAGASIAGASWFIGSRAICY